MPVAVDDATGLSYDEVIPDETGPTTACFLSRAVWPPADIVTIKTLLEEWAYGIPMCQLSHSI